MSPSARKVWIEMPSMPSGSGAVGCHLPRGRCGLKFRSLHRSLTPRKSPSARKVWIEMEMVLKKDYHEVSPSARKVWIEIGKTGTQRKRPAVTFREEGVD